MNARDEIIRAAIDLADALPALTVSTLAEAIRVSDLSRLQAEIDQRIPLPDSRAQATRFVKNWQQTAGDLDSNTVAMVLETALASNRHNRESQSIEVVWTGPDSASFPLRRTEQVILQLLETARERITMVSYAVYRIPFIAEAISKAARRGVRLTVIVETPDKVVGKSEYSTLAALGDEVAKCSAIYYWPKERRRLSASGATGLLHAKCVVADGRRLFLSSANLTQQAFSINLELGLLVKGGPVPSRVDQVFEGLIAESELVPIS
jgi:phosphatidylserine/phosphatidylglycerophosphate/cardiolipin synthase-like enzyme